MHLDGRTIWRFAHPHIEIFALSRLEEEHVIAVIQFGKLVELVQLRLGVEFCIFAAVREERVDIVEQVSLSDAEGDVSIVRLCRRDLRFEIED